MSSGPGGGLIRSIQALYDGGTIAGLDDADLLARYLDGGSREAFEAIVARHGAMVHDVCRGATGSDVDADDAFQAVFLVLACRAASVRRRGSLGPWLFGVARRTALRARKQAARRRELERKAAALTPTAIEPPRVDDSVAALIEEVDRLPSRYREPVVLCHLQGLTHEAAAARLGCPPSTVGVRLMRARERLRTRLERRGVGAPTLAPPGSALPAALAEATSRLALLVAPSLRGGVPVPVLLLTRGALRTMRMTRMISTASAAFLTLAVGAWAWSASPPGEGSTVADAGRATSANVPGKYRLTGRVTDQETGEPVAGATIRVADADGWDSGEIASGRDGKYTMDLPAGDVGTRIFAPPPGYWMPRGPFDLAPMAVSDAHPEEKQDFVMVHGAAWEFRLSWAGNGKPAHHARVHGSGWGGGTSLAVADDAGDARLGVPRAAGEAAITIDTPGPMGWTVPQRVARLRWDDRFDPDAVLGVDRLGGKVARYWLTDRAGRAAMLEDPEGGRFAPRIEAGRLIIDVVLPEPSTETLPDVAGSVVDREGNPIAGATVELSYAWERASGSTSSAMVGSDRCRGETDERGRYRLADVPAAFGGSRPTSVSLMVSRPGFGMADIGPVRLPAEGPLEVPDIVMGPECSAVGTIVGPDRKPVAGAKVTYGPGQSMKMVVARADDAGRFRLDGLPGGPAWLRVRFGELTNHDSANPIVLPNREPIEIQISRPPHFDPPNP